MKSYEIEDGYLITARLIQRFVDGFLDQEEFCNMASQVTTPLLASSKRGVWGILGSHTTFNDELRCLTHEVLHDAINRVWGIPSAGIGAVTEDDRHLVWGVTSMDIEAARTTPDLKAKLKKVQRIHTWIDKIAI